MLFFLNFGAGIGTKGGQIERKELVMVKNPVAKELRTPKFRSKVVKDKKKYDKLNREIKFDGSDWNWSGDTIDEILKERKKKKSETAN